MVRYRIWKREKLTYKILEVRSAIQMRLVVCMSKNLPASRAKTGFTFFGVAYKWWFSTWTRSFHGLSGSFANWDGNTRSRTDAEDLYSAPHSFPLASIIWHLEIVGIRKKIL